MSVEREIRPQFQSIGTYVKRKGEGVVKKVTTIKVNKDLVDNGVLPKHLSSLLAVFFREKKRLNLNPLTKPDTDFRKWTEEIQKLEKKIREYQAELHARIKDLLVATRTLDSELDEETSNLSSEYDTEEVQELKAILHSLNENPLWAAMKSQSKTLEEIAPTDADITSAFEALDMAYSDVRPEVKAKFVTLFRDQFLDRFEVWKSEWANFISWEYWADTDYQVEAQPKEIEGETFVPFLNLGRSKLRTLTSERWREGELSAALSLHSIKVALEVTLWQIIEQLQAAERERIRKEILEQSGRLEGSKEEEDEVKLQLESRIESLKQRSENVQNRFDREHKHIVLAFEQANKEYLEATHNLTNKLQTAMQDALSLWKEYKRGGGDKTSKSSLRTSTTTTATITTSKWPRVGRDDFARLLKLRMDEIFPASSSENLITSLTQISCTFKPQFTPLQRLLGELAHPRFANQRGILIDATPGAGKTRAGWRQIMTLFYESFDNAYAVNREVLILVPNMNVGGEWVSELRKCCQNDKDLGPALEAYSLEGLVEVENEFDSKRARVFHYVPKSSGSSGSSNKGKIPTEMEMRNYFRVVIQLFSEPMEPKLITFLKGNKSHSTVGKAEGKESMIERETKRRNCWLSYREIGKKSDLLRQYDPLANNRYENFPEIYGDSAKSSTNFLIPFPGPEPLDRDAKFLVPYLGYCIVDEAHNLTDSVDLRPRVTQQRNATWWGMTLRRSLYTKLYLYTGTPLRDNLKVLYYFRSLNLVTWPWHQTVKDGVWPYIETKETQMKNKNFADREKHTYEMESKYIESLGFGDGSVNEEKKREIRTGYAGVISWLNLERDPRIYPQLRTSCPSLKDFDSASTTTATEPCVIVATAPGYKLSAPKAKKKKQQQEKKKKKGGGTEINSDLVELRQDSVGEDKLSQYIQHELRAIQVRIIVETKKKTKGVKTVTRPEYFVPRLQVLEKLIHASPNSDKHFAWCTASSYQNLMQIIEKARSSSGVFLTFNIITLFHLKNFFLFHLKTSKSQLELKRDTKALHSWLQVWYANLKLPSLFGTQEFARSQAAAQKATKTATSINKKRDVYDPKKKSLFLLASPGTLGDMQELVVFAKILEKTLGSSAAARAEQKSQASNAKDRENRRLALARGFLSDFVKEIWRHPENCTTNFVGILGDLETKEGLNFYNVRNFHALEIATPETKVPSESLITQAVARVRRFCGMPCYPVDQWWVNFYLYISNVKYKIPGKVGGGETDVERLAKMMRAPALAKSVLQYFREGALDYYIFGDYNKGLLLPLRQNGTQKNEMLSAPQQQQQQLAAMKKRVLAIRFCVNEGRLFLDQYVAKLKDLGIDWKPPSKFSSPSVGSCIVPETVKLSEYTEAASFINVVLEETHSNYINNPKIDYDAIFWRYQGSVKLGEKQSFVLLYRLIKRALLGVPRSKSENKNKSVVLSSYEISESLKQLHNKDQLFLFIVVRLLRQMQVESDQGLVKSLDKISALKLKILQSGGDAITRLAHLKDILNSRPNSKHEILSQIDLVDPMELSSEDIDAALDREDTLYDEKEIREVKSKINERTLGMSQEPFRILLEAIDQDLGKTGLESKLKEEEEGKAAVAAAAKEEEEKQKKSTKQRRNRQQILPVEIDETPVKWTGFYTPMLPRSKEKKEKRSTKTKTTTKPLPSELDIEFGFV